MKRDYQSNLEAKKTLKRYLITMACTLPLLILIGFFLGEHIHRMVRILIFLGVLLVVLFIEEYIYAKISSKRVVKEEKPKIREDVFK